MSKIASAWLFVRKHRYFIAILIIVLIVGVVDEDSILNRQPRRAHIETMRREISDCKARYEEADSKIRDLQTNPETVEKIARERYYMKRPGEDVYIVRER